MTTTICPGCGMPTATEKHPANYHYLGCGLPNIWLRGGVTEMNCTNCGRNYVQIQREGQLLQVIAANLLLRRTTLTGPELKFLRGSCELSQEALAKLLDVRRETVAEREGKAKPRLTKMEMSGTRLMLLASFLDFLSKDNHNLLAPHHVEELKTFVREYTDHLLEEVEREIEKMRNLSFGQSHDSKEWQLQEAA